MNIGQLKRRFEVASLQKCTYPDDRLSPEQISSEVDRAFKTLEDEVLPDGTKFMDASDEQLKEHLARWIDEHGIPEAFSVEYELRRYFSTLRKVSSYDGDDAAAEPQKSW